MIYSPYFRYINALVDAAVHFEHVQVIRRAIKPRTVERSIDLVYRNCMQFTVSQ
jgi:hypothetical protein